MSNFGLNTQVDLEAAISELPASKFLELRDMLNQNPPDKDWRALIRTVESKYWIRPIYIEQWSVNTNGQAAGNLLTELSAQGMNIGELAEYLKRINVDTYNLGLAPYESVVIFEEPEEFQEAIEGRSIQICVQATGSPLPRYQWFFCKNGTDDFLQLEGKIENKLNLDQLTSEDAGTYACQLHNCADPNETKLSEHCLVSVIPDPDPPKFQDPVTPSPNPWVNGISPPLQDCRGMHIQNPDYLSAVKTSSTSQHKLILRHPKDVVVGMNDNFCLSVETQGNPPIIYQWYRGDVPLPQSSSKLAMRIHSRDDFGSYFCLVRNGHITEASNVARVQEKVILPEMTPEIEMVSQPKSLLVKFGASAIFSCEARCSEPLKYQWFKNGNTLQDKTSSEIMFRNIQDKSVEGCYQCEVSVDVAGRYRKMTDFAFLKVEIPQVTDNVQYNPSDKVALLIGNSDYRSEQNLNAPQYDVEDLKELLRKLNFKVVSLLNLTKIEMESAVLEFCQLVDRNVYCVFYFAGHGFEEEGLSYLVPTDAPSGYKCDECVCADAVLDNIQKKQPPLILMILDICRKRNRVTSSPTGSSQLLLRHPLRLSQERRADRGNTVFCYATSVGMNAFEPRSHGTSTHAYQRCNGLLMQHLKKILTKEIGIDALISELKEEFSSNERHGKNQIPELRSNLAEPRRSLADKISTQGNTQIFQDITRRWQNAHEKPRNQDILFSDIGVLVQLSFQSDFSNILNIFTRVLNKGVTDRCTAWTLNPNPCISIDGDKRQVVKRDEPVTTKVTLIDIQKLQNPLIVDVCIDCEIRGKIFMYKTSRDLGLPLVSKMKLWQQRDNFLPTRREPIEQMEESDSIES